MQLVKKGDIPHKAVVIPDPLLILWHPVETFGSSKRRSTEPTAHVTWKAPESQGPPRSASPSGSAAAKAAAFASRRGPAPSWPWPWGLCLPWNRTRHQVVRAQKRMFGPRVKGMDRRVEGHMQEGEIPPGKRWRSLWQRPWKPMGSCARYLHACTKRPAIHAKPTSR